MRASLVLVTLAAASAAACTWIVQFHDQPGGCDGGVCPAEASVADSAMGADGGIDTGVDTSVPDTGSGDQATGGDSAPVPDAPFDPCLGKNGYYCGNNGLDPPGLPDADVVHCIDGSVGSVTTCPGGCLHVVDPFPDACNPCFGVADGSYCGRQLTGFPKDNVDILIQCTSGSVAQQTACAHGCMSSGTTSACYP